MKDYGIVFWIHVVVNIVLYFSWLLFSWWIVLIGVLLLHIQFASIGCILTRAEFGKNEESCFYHYLHKWGLAHNEGRVLFWVRYVSPVVVFCLAVVWQQFFPPLIV